jgi:hypothetical protein
MGRTPTKLPGLPRLASPRVRESPFTGALNSHTRPRGGDGTASDNGGYVDLRIVATIVPVVRPHAAPIPSTSRAPSAASRVTDPGPPIPGTRPSAGSASRPPGRHLGARLRRSGLPMAAPGVLDGDCIAAAQVLLSAGPGDVVTVATDNLGHLGRMVDAPAWESVS